MVTATEAERPQYITEAQQLCRQKEFDRAVEISTAGLAEHGEDPAGRFVLARALYGAGQQDRALQQLQSILGQSGDNPAVYRLIGRIHYENGRLADAVEALDIVLAQKPNDTYAGSIRKVLDGKAQPFEGLASLTLADLYIEQGHRAMAIKMLARLAADDPGNTAVARKLSGLLGGD